MYKPDLSPARRFDEYSCLGTLNVGWLDPAHPSDEFIEAVLKGPLPDTQEYEKFIKKFLECKNKGTTKPF